MYSCTVAWMVTAHRRNATTDLLDDAHGADPNAQSYPLSDDGLRYITRSAGDLRAALAEDRGSMPRPGLDVCGAVRVRGGHRGFDGARRQETKRQPASTYALTEIMPDTT